jgi:hypothetical protein
LIKKPKGTKFWFTLWVYTISIRNITSGNLLINPLGTQAMNEDKAEIQQLK